MEGEFVPLRDAACLSHMQQWRTNLALSEIYFVILLVFRFAASSWRDNESCSSGLKTSAGGGGVFVSLWCCLGFSFLTRFMHPPIMGAGSWAADSPIMGRAYCGAVRKGRIHQMTPWWLDSGGMEWFGSFRCGLLPSMVLVLGLIDKYPFFSHAAFSFGRFVFVLQRRTYNI